MRPFLAYRLAVRNGAVSIYQPDSDSELAMTLNLGQQGLFIQTANHYWLIGVDVANPALVIADSSGGETRYSFDAILGYIAGL